MADEEEEGPKEDPLGPLMQNLRKMQAEEESAKVEGKPKKRAKNKISSAPEPSTTSRYSHLLKDSSDEEEKDETPEEEVNLSALHECFLQKEKEIAQRKLALPSFAQDQVPQEHPKVIALFKDFEAATPTERVQRCNRIKQEQKDYFASLGHNFSSHWGDLLWVLVPANDEPAELMLSMLNARHEWFKQAALPIAKEQWNSRST